jgi:carboxyl-terminal processing protease
MQSAFSFMHHLNTWNNSDHTYESQAHDQWMMLALVPFLAVWPHLETVVVVQVLAVAASAAVLWQLALALGAPRPAAVALALAWLISPSVEGFAYDAFTPVCLTPLLAFGLALAAVRGQRVAALLLAQALFGVKEDVALFVIWTSAIVLWKSDRRLAFGIVALGAINLGAYALYESAHAARTVAPQYWLGDPHPLLHLAFLLEVLLPLAFAPLFTGWRMLLALPFMAELFLAHGYAEGLLARSGSYYTIPIVTLFGLGAALAVARIPRLARVALVLSVLCALTLNPTVLRFGRHLTSPDALYPVARAWGAVDAPVDFPCADQGAWVVAATNPQASLVGCEHGLDRERPWYRDIPLGSSAAWTRGPSVAAGPPVLPLFASASAAGSTVNLLDIVETEFGYTTIVDRYQQPVAPQTLLDGARVGLVAYLRSRGIANPQVGAMHVRPDGRGAVPAIEQQIGLSIERYGARVDALQLVYAAIRGELGALHDPYSVFFTASEVTGFSAAIDGTAFGGIGVQLTFDDVHKQWLAESVFDDGPAAKAGLQTGDAIVAVDGVSLAGLDDARIQALLRGNVGSIVHLTIVRDGMPLPAPLAIVRAAVTPPNVTERLLSGNVGYVALRSFSLDAGARVRAALLRLAGRGARAYIFDLRGNGGGYESAAVHVASVFIASGPIVEDEGRDGKRHVSRADGDAVPALPLIVLVDHDSASGAELVAGAVADRGAGRLLGTQTFGKGVAQSMFPLPDGAAIKLTTARYYTAGGRFIGGVGLRPDVIVEEPAGSQPGVPGRDPQLDRALALLAPEGV